MVEESELDKIWARDKLSRKPDAQFIHDFLVGQVAKRQANGEKGSYVLNIDAAWGGGKSFFLERFGKDLRARGHIVAEVNAWKDDYAEDPYIAIMAALDTAISPFREKRRPLATAWDITKQYGGPLALRVASGLAKNAVKKYVGETIEDLTNFDEAASKTPGEELADAGVDAGAGEVENIFDKALEKLVARFQKEGAAVSEFKEKLEKSLDTLKRGNSISLPFFVLVDELDRCRPTYAIQLLERVKHLFDVDNLVFVFATNTDQLQHSVAGAYGPQFDGYQYLKRFFDRTYVFSTPSKTAFLEALLLNIDMKKIRAPGEDVLEFLVSGFDFFEMDLRAIKQIMETMDATISAWRHTVTIDLMLLLPLCVSFYKMQKCGWNELDHTSLKKWKIPKMIWRANKAVDVSWDIGHGINLSVSLLQSLRAIEEATLQQKFSQGNIYDYVRAGFLPEWNGTRVDRTLPSVQFELPNLVANAGRLSGKRKIER